METAKGVRRLRRPSPWLLLAALLLGGHAAVPEGGLRMQVTVERAEVRPPAAGHCEHLNGAENDRCAASCCVSKRRGDNQR